MEVVQEASAGGWKLDMTEDGLPRPGVVTGRVVATAESFIVEALGLGLGGLEYASRLMRDEPPQGPDLVVPVSRKERCGRRLCQGLSEVVVSQLLRGASCFTSSETLSQ